MYVLLALCVLASAPACCPLPAHRYGGYAGELDPEDVQALLAAEGSNALLVDVRSDEARAKDGVPELRFDARWGWKGVWRGSRTQRRGGMTGRRGKEGSGGRRWRGQGETVRLKTGELETGELGLGGVPFSLLCSAQAGLSY